MRRVLSDSGDGVPGGGSIREIPGAAGNWHSEGYPPTLLPCHAYTGLAKSLDRKVCSCPEAAIARVKVAGRDLTVSSVPRGALALRGTE